jgi:CheY-like chemotaxis protein
MKALLVDPDPNRSPILADALAAGGAEVSVAPSASFALTMLEWNKQDVIVSRARLGDMEGHELCSIVRSDPSTKDVRFILMVAPGEAAPAQTAAAGVDLMLPDALSTTTVVTRVVQLVRRQIEMTAAAASLEPAPAVAPVAARTPAPVEAPPAAPPPVIPPPIPSPILPPVQGRPPEPPALAPPVVAPAATAPAPSVVAPAPIVGQPPGPAAVSAMASLDNLGSNGGARTFQGALGVLEVEELTQAIAVGGKTGRLVLVLAAGGGLIVFEGGRVTHAEFAGQSGEAAFATLVAAAHRERGGKFCFIPVQPIELRNQPKTIERGVEQLLLDVAHAMDEERRA